MIPVVGKYNTAICYTDILDDKTYAQILTVCNEEAFADAKIRIMPDVHVGKGCTIGTTMTITDKVVPGMVGVDIGCGMETVRIAEKELDLPALDKWIRKQIPAGASIRKTEHAYNEEIDLEALRCASVVNLIRARRSIGTLGGGNHFIEVDKDEEGNLYLVVHSGSRHIGTEVAMYYQEEGYRALCGTAEYQIREKNEELKAVGSEQEIRFAEEEMKAEQSAARPIAKELAYVEGVLFDDYIHDMKILQRYAELNRKAMMETILTGMGLTEVERFTTIHNYIDTERMILRKGAVSAREGEKLLIPINMRDGSLICLGKGNDEWNQSAPHGAGRLLSRGEAYKQLSVEEYRKQMEGIYSSCISRKTIDESPMAYKNMDDIVRNIEPTAEILCHVRPIYNFKAAE